MVPRGVSEGGDRPVRPARTAEAIESRKVENKEIVFTFDDGLRSARDWWKTYRLPCTIFVNPGIVTSILAMKRLELPHVRCVSEFEYKTSSDGFLTWEEIAELEENGVEIGCHTLWHEDVARRKVEKVGEDLEHCTWLFKRFLKRPVETFAYPNCNVAYVSLVREFFPKIRLVGVPGKSRLLFDDVALYTFHFGDTPYIKKLTEKFIEENREFKTFGSLPIEHAMYMGE